MRLSGCARQRLGIGIESDDLELRSGALDLQGDVPGSAADLEDLLCGGELGLIGELLVGGLGSGQAGEGG